MSRFTANNWLHSLVFVYSRTHTPFDPPGSKQTTQVSRVQLCNSTRQTENETISDWSWLVYTKLNPAQQQCAFFPFNSPPPWTQSIQKSAWLTQSLNKAHNGKTCLRLAHASRLVYSSHQSLSRSPSFSLHCPVESDFWPLHHNSLSFNLVTSSPLELISVVFSSPGNASIRPPL